MSLTMRERKSLIRVTAPRYHKAGKGEKTRILNELVKATEYDRRYASWLLRTQGKVVRVKPGLTIVGDVGVVGERRGAKPRYGPSVFEAVKRIWEIMDYICGKRLAASLSEIVPILETHKEIRLKKDTREKLQRISAATIDRMLKPERKKHQIRGRSGTKPGTLLKNQIPIRTYAEWNDKKPGFMEIDLVGHDGGSTSGDYCQTLDMTDVHSGWTETGGVKNKAQVWVFEAIKKLRKQMPFELLGIDSDNGSEFINHHLMNYCEQEKITFTRGRANRKNDGCYVEQKNYSVVRRMVGYGRYDTAAELEMLNELYSHLRLYSNYFLPVMKLIKKERVGSKVTKHYDKPQTPYHRLLQSPDISSAVKRRLRREYALLNPAELKRRIEALQTRLDQSVIAKTKKRA